MCRNFRAPKFIDPKFLDPRHAFKEVLAPSTSENGMGTSSARSAQLNVFQPEKKRRKRDGYDEGDYTLHKTVSARAYLIDHDPLNILANVNRITFSTEEEKRCVFYSSDFDMLTFRSWLLHHETTSEIIANCEDLKVLGKSDFKRLIRWRIAMREHVSAH